MNICFTDAVLELNFYVDSKHLLPCIQVLAKLT